jgi:hypothetical protein
MPVAPTEPEKEPRFKTPYTRHALEWIAVIAFFGVAGGLVAIVWAMAYWAWSA